MITKDQIKALDPTMAVIVMSQSAPLTKAAWSVLESAVRNGGYVEAGVGVTSKGSVERISAAAVTSLIKRGYLDQRRNNETGGVAGSLSQRSLDRLTAAMRTS
jgi:hypothetical protein